MPSTSTANRLGLAVRPSATRPGVMVACPDARPPAYQAAVGLANRGRLDSFVTAFYRGDGPLSALAAKSSRWDRVLSRRHDPEIPAHAVRSFPAFDLALMMERKLPPGARHSVARWRTRRFDGDVARSLARSGATCLLAFSDVASGIAIPRCRDLGIPVVLSMVHGDVREEAEVLDRERERAPDFFPIYLADGPVDRRELSWLHARRLADLEGADRVLVPSEHIADVLERRGTPRSKVAVVPYAADCRRFVPEPDKEHGPACRFLFAGGITQRKGIKYLLDAWRLVRRPGWKLSLVGGLPREADVLRPYRDEVEWLGRVGHGAMPAIMAGADVFVFPSLFEGSAVVTYEALACGLPTIVTAEAGSVARHEKDGLVVPSADIESLAAAMEKLGLDPAMRSAMSASARARAEDHDWPRYHEAIVRETDLSGGAEAGPRSSRCLDGSRAIAGGIR